MKLYIDRVDFDNLIKEFGEPGLFQVPYHALTKEQNSQQWDIEEEAEAYLCKASLCATVRVNYEDEIDLENEVDIFNAGYLAAQQGLDQITVVTRNECDEVYSSFIIAGSSEKLIRDLTVHFNKGE